MVTRINNILLEKTNNPRTKYAKIEKALKEICNKHMDF